MIQLLTNQHKRSRAEVTCVVRLKLKVISEFLQNFESDYYFEPIGYLNRKISVRKHYILNSNLWSYSIFQFLLQNKLVQAVNNGFANIIQFNSGSLSLFWIPVEELKDGRTWLISMDLRNLCFRALAGYRLLSAEIFTVHIWRSSPSLHYRSLHTDLHF